MGTLLFSRGVGYERCFDELNLSQPGVIEGIHREYLTAGAELIETNTFGTTAFVAGSKGPLGAHVEPFGEIAVAEAEKAFRGQAEGLLEGGLDVFLLETFQDLNEILAAIRAIRSITTEVLIVAQMTFGLDGKTRYGHTPQLIAKALRNAGASVIGVNCGVGPQPTKSRTRWSCMESPLWLSRA